MADCNETLRELDRFLDNELASEVLGEMMEHLDQCVTVSRRSSSMRNCVRS